MIQNETAKVSSSTVDRFNQEKLYIQLTRILLGRILAGQWEVGRQIPTEAELCQEHGVSKITVRQAIKNLVAEGYLHKIQGKGTFVISSEPPSGFTMKTRFTEEMFGKEVQVRKKVLARGVQPVAGLADAYLKTREDIYRIVSQREVGGEPISLDESYVPVSMLPGGARELDVENQPLLTLLQEQGSQKIFKIIQTVEIAPVPGEHSSSLGLAAGVPVLVIHRLFLGRNETPLAYTRFLGRSDRYKFQTEFQRLR